MQILHYLRLDSFILVLLFLSILCMYYAVTAKLKSKSGNLLAGCLSVAGVIMLIDRVSVFTNIFVPYLPTIHIVNWVLFCITMFLIFYINIK